MSYEQVKIPSLPHDGTNNGLLLDFLLGSLCVLFAIGLGRVLLDPFLDCVDVIDNQLCFRQAELEWELIVPIITPMKLDDRLVVELRIRD
jgi:hypothetical protein